MNAQAIDKKMDRIESRVKILEENFKSLFHAIEELYAMIIQKDSIGEAKDTCTLSIAQGSTPSPSVTS